MYYILKFIDFCKNYFEYHTNFKLINNVKIFILTIHVKLCINCGLKEL